MVVLRLFTTLLLVILVFASCQKEQAAKVNQEMEGSLLGTWELARTRGGMSPDMTHPAGNGNRLRFEATSYQHIKAGQVIHQGTYQLANEPFVDVNSCEKVAPKNELPNTIIYDAPTNPFKAYFSIAGNTLTITTSCIPVDGGVSVYRKVESDQASQIGVK